MSFNGKTIFITGASRGIGKAMGLKLAKEGANVVVAAKSVEENPKLGGTIFSAANEMEEALFEAQFLDGKNIDDEETLIQLAKSIGITEDEAKNALQSDELGYLVKQDMQLAAQLGINAVPFFVINDKYGISGAQQPELFLEALEKTWEEFSNGDKGLQLINSGDSCDIDGNCD